MCAFDFSSARAKLRRAQIHLKQAQAIYTAYVDDNPYTTFRDMDSDGWHRIGIATIKAWPPELALVLGDAANCLRASLDHLAFACVIGKPNPKEEKAIEFPILNTTQQFQSTMGKLSKWLSPSALPLFEEFQPGPSPKSPDVRYLEILREVNNRDKHRALSIIYGLAKRTSVIAYRNSAAVIAMEPHGGGRLEVGAILARFKLRERVRGQDVQMQAETVIVPIFGDGMPNIAIGESAITALVTAHNFIRKKIFPAFEAIT